MSDLSSAKKLVLTTKDEAKSYDIFIGKNLLCEIGKFAREVNSGKKACIITDSNVAPLYEEVARKSLEKAGFEVSTFMFRAGEKSKTINTISEMYTHLAKENLTRSDLIIALGGGVTGDMAGYTAATWMRGIDFIQVPTTLLAQVDSSIGGKTGVDIPEGKNLVGAFWQPKKVVVDTETLNTLSDEFLADGMAEVIKMGCILDREFYEKISEKKISVLDMVERSIDLKREVVEKDEKEAGQRKLLNFGHTLAHALERHYKFEMSHGKAVAVGMVWMSKVGENLGVTKKSVTEKIIEINELYNLPTDDIADIFEILPYVSLDKKRSGSSIDLVFLKDIGEAFVQKIEIKDLEKTFRILKSEG